MAKMITVKIDVNKVDNNRLYRGEKGLYLDAVIFMNDGPDQYGNDGMIVQQVLKEERERGVKGAILGNVKIIGQQQAPQQQQQQAAPWGQQQQQQQATPWQPAAANGNGNLPF